MLRLLVMRATMALCIRDVTTMSRVVCPQREQEAEAHGGQQQDEKKDRKKLMTDIQKYAVGSLDTIFYIPDFLTFVEQESLYRQVKGAPIAKWKYLKNRRLQHWGGVVLEKGLIPQSLPSWLSPLTERIVIETGLLPSPINHVLVNEYEPGQGIMPHQDGPLYFPVVAIVSLGSPTLMRFSPHSKIVNAEEAHGSEGKANGNPDDKKETERKIEDRVLKDVSIVLMPGSLLLFKDTAYEDYLHGIDECVEHLLDETVLNPEVITEQEPVGKDDNKLSNTLGTSGGLTLRRTGTRISLTCRHVPKVSKLFKF